MTTQIRPTCIRCKGVPVSFIRLPKARLLTPTIYSFACETCQELFVPAAPRTLCFPAPPPHPGV